MPTLLIDTDIGTDVDDAVALLLAARLPDVELASVTTVARHAELRARLARRLLDLGGRPDIPVAAGHDFALPSDRFRILFPDGFVLGHEGKPLLDHDERAAALAVPPDPAQGNRQLAAAIATAAEPAVVVLLGQCTNLAAALAEQPELSERIGRVVAMGGMIREEGWVAGYRLPRRSEFNFNSDREAIVQLLERGIDLTILPGEFTFQAFLTEAHFGVLRSSEDPALRALCALAAIWGPMFRTGLTRLGVPEAAVADIVCHLHDPMTVLVAAQPELFRFEEYRIDVVEVDRMLVTVPSAAGAFAVRAVTGADERHLPELVVNHLLTPAREVPAVAR